MASIMFSMIELTMTSLAAHLKTLRKTRKLTQTQLAKLIGVNTRGLQPLEARHGCTPQPYPGQPQLPVLTSFTSYRHVISGSLTFVSLART